MQYWIDTLGEYHRIHFMENYGRSIIIIMAPDLKDTLNTLYRDARYVLDNQPGFTDEQITHMEEIICQIYLLKQLTELKRGIF